MKIGRCESGKIRDLFGTLRYYGNACAAQVRTFSLKVFQWNSAFLITEECRLKSLNILQIVSEVSNEMVISNEDVDGYLMEKLIPYVSCQYEKTIKVHATLNELIGDLISAVEKTQEQVFQVQV